VIAACDRSKMQQSARNRVLGKHTMPMMVANIGDATIVADPSHVEVVDVVGVANKTATSASGRRWHDELKGKANAALLCLSVSC
jgi:hypothetical protein